LVNVKIIGIYKNSFLVKLLFKLIKIMIYLSSNNLEINTKRSNNKNKLNILIDLYLNLKIKLKYLKHINATFCHMFNKERMPEI